MVTWNVPQGDAVIGYAVSQQVRGRRRPGRQQLVLPPCCPPGGKTLSQCAFSLKTPSQDKFDQKNLSHSRHFSQLLIDQFFEVVLLSGRVFVFLGLALSLVPSDWFLPPTSWQRRILRSLQSEWEENIS